MELPPHEGGINELTFELSKENSQTFFLQNTKNMQKLSGRVPGTIYGKDLSHIFIYDKSTVKIDYSNYKATILYFDNNQIDDYIIWKLLKALSSIPLLDICSLIPPSWGGNSILAKNCCSEVFLPQKLANNMLVSLPTKLSQNTPVCWLIWIIFLFMVISFNYQRRYINPQRERIYPLWVKNKLSSSLPLFFYSNKERTP
jgi:hypothetical protein